MKKGVKIIFLSLTIMLLARSHYAQTANKDFQDGKVIFQIRENVIVSMVTDAKGVVSFNKVPFLAALSSKYGITKVQQKHPRSTDISLRNTYEINFSKLRMTDSLVAELSKISFVRYAEKKTLPRLFYIPNDSLYSGQYNLSLINAPAAWDITLGKTSIVVADIDNAILITHPDLVSQISSKSYDIADNDANPSPPVASSSWDHGTHTAGILDATTNNKHGVASIGSGLSLMAIKATTNNSSSPGVITDGFEGVLYAVDSGARVISCSWGTPTSSSYDSAIVQYAHARGCIIVAAAGNSGINTPYYPAAYPHVIAVASTGSGDVLSSFSDYGSWVTLCAPGENIISTITNHVGSMGIAYYDKLSGTSMATPLVAGLCGLMLSLNPSLTPDQVLSCLKKSCVNINSKNPSKTGDLGAGRINAQGALDSVLKISTPPVANFTANHTAIVAGGSVNFSDLSTNNPSSWSWTFSGGTPGTSTGKNPGGIVYNTPGCYPVTLSVTNSSGTNPLTKTCFIDVTSGTVTTECTTIIPTATAQLQFYKNGNGWGYVTGSNSDAVEAICDYFSTPPPAGYQISGTEFLFGKAVAGNPSHTISVNIWDNAAGFPTNVLANKIVKINTISTTGITSINFDTPVAVNGPYYLGIQFSATDSPLDTIALVSTVNGEIKPSTAWSRLNDGLWYTDSVLWGGAILSQTIGAVICRDSPTGIAEQTVSSDMEVFPNPTTGEINIVFPPGLNENLRVFVYNGLGAVIAEAGRADLQSGTIKMNLAGKSSGIYFIESRTDHGTAFKKIILTQ